jgi:hypothetical protein
MQSFYQVVLNWQRRAFSTIGCQHNPWDEVLPLFDKGYQAVVQGLAEEGEKTLVFQGRALDAWQAALQKLKNPSKSTNSSCKGAQPEQPKSKEQKSRPNFDKVAGQLLMMQAEDKQPKPQPEQPERVERPW